MFGLFNKKKTDESSTKIITLMLNDKCGPMARGEIYREPLDEYLVSKGLGEVEGGGTQLQANGERAYCDVGLMINNESDLNIEELVKVIKQIGTPKGSLLINDHETIAVGDLEGVGVYFRFAEAPEKLFDEIDTDEFWDGIDEAVKPFGKYHDYWQGNEKGAFYYYGKDAEAIVNAVKEKIKGHPFESFIDPIVLPSSID